MVRRFKSSLSPINSTSLQAFHSVRLEMLNLSTMELRKTASTILRTQASPLTSILIAPASTRWATTPLRLSQRTFTSSARRYTSDMKHSDPSTATPESQQNTIANENDKNSPDSQPTSQHWADAGARGNSSSSIITPLKSTSNSNGDLWRRGLRSTDAARDLLTGFNIGRKGLGPDSPLNQRSQINLDRMLSPNVSQSDMLDVMRNLNSAMRAPEVAKPALRLNAKTGRTVTVGGGIDIGRSFRLLEQSCNRNKVRNDFKSQRFHERGGLKRKRLRRERWRRRFMDGFKATVARVKEMKRQGW